MVRDKAEVKVKQLHTVEGANKKQKKQEKALGIRKTPALGKSGECGNRTLLDLL
jgi:hypothetical protein